MEDNIQIPDSQDDDRELHRAFQYAANRDRYDQLAELGRQLLHDQNIRSATIRRWLPWAAAAGAALFCLGFWLGRQVPGDRKPDTTSPEQQLIPVATKLDSFVFFAASGEKFIVSRSSGVLAGDQPKLEMFSAQGHLMGDFYQYDTLPPLIIKPKLKPAPGNDKVGESKRASSPVVANPKNKGLFFNSTLPAHRIRVTREQKTIEPLPAVQANAFDGPDMRCVFYGDRIRFSAPAKLVEGQPIEIIELRGAGTEDGFYLRIGNQYFLLNTDGNTFDLKPAPKPKAFD